VSGVHPGLGLERFELSGHRALRRQT